MSDISRYATFLKKQLAPRQKLRVVFDSSNGAAGVILKHVFEKKDGDFFFLNAAPDGRFPAHGPNPLAPHAADALIREVKRRQADFGVIFDADGDRVFFVDDRGQLLSPDCAIILTSMGFKGAVVIDERSCGFLLREWLAGQKRLIIRSKIGHFFIRKLMRRRRIAFGGEMSGHYYFQDFFFSDGGIFAAIQVLNQVAEFKSRSMRLSDWANSLPRYHRIPETNFAVAGKEKITARIEKHFRKSARSVSRLDGLTMEFGHGKQEWWFNVRPSNTEDLLRLNLEARTAGLCQAKLKEVKRLIDK